MPAPSELWPASAEELEKVQPSIALAADGAPQWNPPDAEVLRVAGVFVAFARGASGPGSHGDAAWVGAAMVVGGQLVAGVAVEGRAGAPYAPGLLALREGRLLERAVKALDDAPDVVLVDATGRDHPRRAGLALHLGAVLDIPTIGVTDRPLLAQGSDAPPVRGATAGLYLDGRLVAVRLRTLERARPVVVHAAWRTEPYTAGAVVLALSGNARTPLPLREARRLARTARSAGSIRQRPS